MSQETMIIAKAHFQTAGGTTFPRLWLFFLNKKVGSICACRNCAEKTKSGRLAAKIIDQMRVETRARLEVGRPGAPERLLTKEELWTLITSKSRAFRRRELVQHYRAMEAAGKFCDQLGKICEPSKCEWYLHGTCKPEGL